MLHSQENGGGEPFFSEGSLSCRILESKYAHVSKMFGENQSTKHSIGGGMWSKFVGRGVKGVGLTIIQHGTLRMGEGLTCGIVGVRG